MSLKKIAAFALALSLLALPAFAQNAAPPAIDSGNTAWLLVSSALVMLMTPGLAFFYAGMVSRKNVVSTLLQNYVPLALIGLIWVAIGYSLVFTEGNGFIGGTSLWMLNGTTSAVYASANVPLLAFIAFQMMFAIITPALITGSFAERVNFSAWLWILAFWSLLIYVPVAHWVWGPGGWIAAMGGIDFAGGLVVHVTAGFSALVAGILFGRRYNAGHVLPNDVPMILLGAGLLWFGWFGFNAGSALTSGALAAHAFMTTFVGAAAAFLAWMAVDWIRSGKPSATGSAIGLVVGLVCITPAAGYVTIPSAIIMCLFAGVVCNLVAAFVKKITRLDDALDVFACHGVGGALGAVLTGLFADKSVNATLTVQGYFVSGETSLFMANLYGLLAVAAFSIVGTFIIIRFVGLFVKLRVSDEHEMAGLDTSIHGENAKHNDRSHQK